MFSRRFLLKLCPALLSSALIIITVDFMYGAKDSSSRYSGNGRREDRLRNVDLSSGETMDTEESPIIKRLTERRLMLREQCKGKDLQCALNATLTFHMYPFHDYNATVCTIAKAGSSTWRDHLRRVNEGPPSYLPIKEDPRRKVLLSHSVTDSFEFIKGTAKIITVRHPLTRLVSCYRNKYKGGRRMPNNYPERERRRREYVAGSYWPDRFAQFWLPALVNNGLVPQDMHTQLGLPDPIDPNTRYKTWVYERMHKILQPRLTFVQFLRHVIATYRVGRPDAHWSQYSRDCCPCVFHYDFVTRVETLTEDLQEIFNVLGIPSQASVSANQNRRSLSDPYEDLSYYRRVPLEVRKELYPFIRTDIEMFGYKLPKGFLEDSSH